MKKNHVVRLVIGIFIGTYSCIKAMDNLKNTISIAQPQSLQEMRTQTIYHSL